MLETYVREAPLGSERTAPGQVEHDGLGRSAERLHGDQRTPPPRRSRTAASAKRERRSVRKIRFSGAEWALVEERARACGRAPARYVREVALGAVPKVSRTRANAPVIRELGALAAAVQRLRPGLPASDSVAVGVPGSAPDAGAPGGGEDLGVDLDAVVRGLLAVIRRLA